MHRTDNTHNTFDPVWPNGWVFIYKLSGCGFESISRVFSFRFLFFIYFFVFVSGDIEIDSGAKRVITGLLRFTLEWQIDTQKFSECQKFVFKNESDPKYFSFFEFNFNVSNKISFTHTRLLKFPESSPPFIKFWRIFYPTPSARQLFQTPLLLDTQKYSNNMADNSLNWKAFKNIVMML